MCQRRGLETDTMKLHVAAAISFIFAIFLYAMSIKYSAVFFALGMIFEGAAIFLVCKSIGRNR
jgi:hypothetical protein